MVGQQFLEALVDVYRGEQFGEAFFEALLPHAEDDEQRYILGSLLQLESEGKAVMRPVLTKLRLSLNEDPGSRPQGVKSAGALREMSWTEQFAAMAAGIRSKGLPQYEELVTLVSADEDPEAFALANFMGKHERAILTASENIAAGRPDPVAPVVEILNFPLIKTGTRSNGGALL
ncbi:MAG: hypothetical protein AAFY37_02350 [Pseudomonadota bacterium]